MLPEPPVNVCHFFQLLSRDVWSRIAFARAMNLKISETTITENLLYNFYDYFEHYAVPVRLYESKEERRNGSDLEVLVETEQGYILLACQAKITYKTGNYAALHHEVGGLRQIDLLMDYAKLHGGIAHYLFYNCPPDFMLPATIGEHESIEDNGITHLEAQELIEWMVTAKGTRKRPPTPSYTTFHPTMAEPFHELICQLLSHKHASKTILPATIRQDITYYNENQVNSEANWREVTSLATVGYVQESIVFNGTDETSDLQPTTKEPEPKYYRPKFRLVIGSANSDGGGIIGIS